MVLHKPRETSAW